MGHHRNQKRDKVLTHAPPSVSAVSPDPRGALREPTTTDGTDLVHEDDAWRVLTRIVKHLTHDARRLADVLVDDRGGDGLWDITQVASQKFANLRL